MKRRYVAEVPMTVDCTVSFVFDSDEELTETEVLDLIFENANISLSAESENPDEYDVDVCDWSMHQRVVEGNVCHAVLNKASLYVIEELE